MIAERRGAFGDKIVKLLIVDDNPVDAELSLIELRRAGVATECVIVADEAQLRTAVKVFAPDVILCDHGFPNFDGFAAQSILREVYPETPLIFVSGTISEDRAVTALQSGAVDYVLKTNLLRLPSAVQRAVREAAGRQRLEASLHEQEEHSREHAQRLEALWRLVNDPSLHDEALWVAMLAQSAAAIRSGQSYAGKLWRLEGADLIVQATTEDPGRLPAVKNHVGSDVPVETTAVHTLLAEGGGTRSWDDIQAATSSEGSASASGTRTLVITSFTAGGAKWALSFASDTPARKPLGPEEHAYIEVLASFFANHVHQRWQFERIQFQQSHDVLTGLLNRSQFRSRVRAESRTSPRMGVILVDIDAFHEINEAHGTTAGDAVLVEVGNALLNRASGGEIVGRMGVDVFGIYVPDPVSHESLRARARDFAEVFARPFATGDPGGREFIAWTASLGVALIDEGSPDPDALLAHVEAALFIAKERGRGSLVFYEAGMKAESQRRATLRSELAEAVARDQFTLYYQPHVEITTGAVTGCEALIRWNHPVRGLVLPSQFIPFAEQTGIITSIDAWVMRNALADAPILCGLRPGFRLYFNLSGRQAGDPKLIRAFVQAARSGVSLSSIGVEITESDAMRDVEATRRVCRALRRLDVRIAIDDFGTGYSSLSFLKRLPVDIVKIDRGFISGIINDPHDEAIAETIISIADRFGFESLAEGVEQPEELAWLRKRACRYAQGFAICHPLPIDDFRSWLSARGSSDTVLAPQRSLGRTPQVVTDGQ